MGTPIGTRNATADLNAAGVQPPYSASANERVAYVAPGGDAGTAQLNNPFRPFPPNHQFYLDASLKIVGLGQDYQRNAEGRIVVYVSVGNFTPNLAQLVLEGMVQVIFGSQPDAFNNGNVYVHGDGMAAVSGNWNQFASDFPSVASVYLRNLVIVDSLVIGKDLFLQNCQLVNAAALSATGPSLGGGGGSGGSGGTGGGNHAYNITLNQCSGFQNIITGDFIQGYTVSFPQLAYNTVAGAAFDNSFID